MSNQKKQWGAIIVMIALFAMIAFVTNLCTPMATIIKNQGEISNVLAQIGNYGNFIAYLVMGIPAGMLIAKFGYKKTALIGLAVGATGILIQWVSGLLDVEQNLGLVFAVYLIGAFIAGLCMCILNCVVNPMLNILGGGGNSGNQLIQIGGVFNSSAAVACYILMGALIADAYQHSDLPGIALGHGLDHETAFPLMDGADGFILTGIGLHGKALAAGKQCLHNLNMLLLGIGSGNAIESGRRAKQDQRRQKNRPDGQQNLFYFHAAPPFLRPNRRGGV